MSATPLNVPARDETVTGAAGVATINDVVRNVAGTDGKVSLSSERFDFVDTEESGFVNSIDQASQLYNACKKATHT